MTKATVANTTQARNPLSDTAFREALRAVVKRSRRSMRSLSIAMGRDPGYLAALLDPNGRPRARPTPLDLLAVSEVTGIPFVELLEQLWVVPRERLVAELGLRGAEPSLGALLQALPPDEREAVADFAAFLAARARRRRRPYPTGESGGGAGPS
jgi:hypothetical protein